MLEQDETADYHRHRAQEELERSLATSDTVVARVHLQLADLHMKKAEELAAEPPPQIIAPGLRQS